MPVGIVPDGLEGQRADVGIARLFGLARSRVAEAADHENLFVNGVAVDKATRLHAGAMAEVVIEAPRVVSVTPVLAAGLTVVFDDDDIVVVDKPAGVAAHPSLGWTGPDVVGHLAAAGYRISTSGPAERQGIVSRLDVGTSGLMVVAKSEVAYTALKRAFRNREVTKVYHALVQGYLDPALGVIDAPIGHARTDEWKMAIDPAGRTAVTHYDTLSHLRGASLLQIRLETGRTHQIRVHMASLRHPCVGDLLYGADPALAARLGLDRQWLHARQLGFRHPRTGEQVSFQAGYPADLASSLAALSAW